ncbi:Molybdopterin converting factor, small subunit [Thermodesulfobium acidiphilum]|uniref:Molybdopterin converting factor, small subunit n=1 Tax=Thermodesulfobium acidiphilum TaxID=1794699 RepID=A0A2R4W2S1_THEAF|nr:MoaD/ThiS family protein [Thermodesulfobium acidiphilum]AWB11008.1 Molybdopterin converting factor, small subunit [Thermodesulfobium acidiphilum]
MPKITVALYAGLKARAHAPEGASEFDLDIPEGSKIGDIIKLLDLPDDEVANIFVDRSLKDREYIVKDGQRIAFFPLIAGG